MEEEYRKIEGYENYSISNFGNVKNNQTGKMLKPSNVKGYLSVKLNNKSNLIHRLIANAFIPNPDNKPFIDHIDNNRANNSINNLRWATPSENNYNQKLGKRNKSGFKGVHQIKETGFYRAQIQVNGNIISIGIYTTIEKAIEARVKKATELFGEFKNECEKIKDDTKTVINIKKSEIEELEELEREFEDLIKMK